jgi:hypothetical protein
MRQGNLLPTCTTASRAKARQVCCRANTKVLINKSVNPDGTPYVHNPDVAPIDSTARELLPPNYSDFEQTTLQLEVGLASVNKKYELKSGK